MYKNIASQKVAIYAHDVAADAAKTGDAANITAYISKDGGAAAQSDDVNPTELDAVNMKGIYVFDMTQAETNADMIALSPVSATADIQIEPVIIYTAPTAAQVADAVLDEAASDHVAADTVGYQVKTAIDALVTGQASVSLAADQSGATIGTVNALGTQAKTDVLAAITDDDTKIDGSALNALSALAPDNTIADTDDVSGVAGVFTKHYPNE